MPQPQRSSKPPRLKTNRANLQLIQMLTLKDDTAFFALQNANLDFWKEFGNSIDESVEAVAKRRLENGNNRFGIYLRKKLIGIVGYSTKDHPTEAEVGILLDKNVVGRGYAQAAIKAITEYAKPLYARVFAEVEPDNRSSIKLMTRSGYKTDGKVVDREWGRALVFEAS